MPQLRQLRLERFDQGIFGRKRTSRLRLIRIVALRPSRIRLLTCILFSLEIVDKFDELGIETLVQTRKMLSLARLLLQSGTQLLNLSAIVCHLVPP